MFIEQAYKGNNKWWRVLLTALLTSGVFIANFIMYFVSSKEQLQAAYDLMKDIPNNLSLIINLFPFVFLLGLLFLLVYVLNNRSILSLTTTRVKVDFKRIFFSFGLIYLGSLIFGSLLTLYFHSNDYSYRAIGASGAVTGVLYSAILLQPNMDLYLFFIPIPIPAYIFGIGYLLYSIYGMKAKRDNIGHTAHFGGAIGGYLITLLKEPHLLIDNLEMVILLAIPIVLLFILAKLGKI